MPESVPEVKAQMVPLPQQADVSAAGQTGEEMAWEELLFTSDAAALDEEPAREEPLPHEVMVII
jgi:hypothetical protein